MYRPEAITKQRFEFGASIAAIAWLDESRIVCATAEGGITVVAVEP